MRYSHSGSIFASMVDDYNSPFSDYVFNVFLSLKLTQRKQPKVQDHKKDKASVYED